MAPPGGRGVHPHGRPAARVLQPAAVLRPGPAGRLREVGLGIAEGPRLRVATWNIRAAIGPGEPFPPGWWRHVTAARFERIARILRDVDADIIGLQEVAFYDVGGELFDQPLALAGLIDRHVRYAAVHAYALVEPDTGLTVGSATWGNALLTREPVTDGFALGLPFGSDDEVVEPAAGDLPLAGVRFADAPYGAREPRCVVGGTVTGKDGPVRAVVTHLSYAGASQRRAQAGHLAELVARRDAPLVLLGDLNAPIDSMELTPLSGMLDDAFAAVGLTASDPRRQTCGALAIDHVLTRGLLAEDCRVVVDTGDASDHLPVVATLRQPADRSSNLAT